MSPRTSTQGTRAPYAGLRNPVGTHVQVGKGLVAGALAQADALGCETIQVFAGNPRGWTIDRVVSLKVIGALTLGVVGPALAILLGASVTLCVVALLAGVVSTFVACREDLNGSAGCPSLCPEQNVESKDTLLDAFVSVDTTIVGYPAIGTETQLLLAARGDTLDARAVMRFDSLTQQFTRGGADSAIYALDSAFVRLELDSTGTKATEPATVDVDDVDTVAVDTAVVLLESEEDVTDPERFPLKSFTGDPQLTRARLIDVLRRAGRRVGNELVYARSAGR